MPTLTSKDWQREQTLPYVFDPGVDYTLEVEKRFPEWRPNKYKTDARWPGVQFPHSTKPNVIRDRLGATHAIPAIRYVRFVDHAGNVHPLSISTVPAGPGPTEQESYEDGYDRIGTETRVTAEKRRKGNLILELDQHGPKGITGQEYLCWALVVADDRKRRHNEYELEERDALMNRAQRQMIDLQKEQIALQGASDVHVAKIVADAMAQVQAQSAPAPQQMSPEELATVVAQAVAQVLASQKPGKER